MRGKKLTHKQKMVRLSERKSERRKVFLELCKHLTRGLSLDCFGPLSRPTILEYCKNYPEEFNEVELQEACRLGKQMWEDLGYQQSNGTCLGNSRTWFYNMAHRYQWTDRVHVEAEHKGTVNVAVVNYASKAPPQHSESK